MTSTVEDTTCKKQTSREFTKNIIKKMEHILSKFIHLPSQVILHSNDSSNVSFKQYDELLVNDCHPPFDSCMNFVQPERPSLTHHSNKYTPQIDLNMYMKMFIHELRTPLNTITMGIDLIHCETKPSSESKENFADIRQSIKFMNNIFDKFAVIQDGNIHLNIFTPFSINEMFRIVTNILRFHFNENQVQFDFMIDSNVYDWNYGDKHNIKHCIINLLNNAIKYRESTRKSIISIDVKLVLDKNPSESDAGVVRQPSPPTTLQPSKPGHMIRGRQLYMSRATPSCSQKNQQTIEISIKDNNKYIPSNIKEHLFEQFNTTSGSGLGLYICKTIVELHGGTIAHSYITPVGSNAGDSLDELGNNFTITIPLNICSDRSLQKTTRIHTPEPEPEPEPEPGIIILIVDDSILNRKMFYKTIKMMNPANQVYTVSDGEKCILFMLTHPKIEIILMDRYMPNMDGIMTTKKIRENGYNHIIIGITGMDNPDEIQEFIQNGADYVFIKPMDNMKISLLQQFICEFGTARMANQTIQLKDDRLYWK